MQIIKSILSAIKNIHPRLKKYILFGLLIIILIIFGSRLLNSNPKKSPISSNSQANPPQKSETLNKEFDFPVTVSGTQTTSLKFIVESAELNNQIVVQGQNAQAVAGRTFLIISLAITNSFDKSIQINTRDYVRLSVNGDENTWLAPDIHNDPVEVQAISTKYTRVGFPVNTSDKNFVLQIGEIKGDKQKINLTL